jgi:PAS domain S-box-containing protein
MDDIAKSRGELVEEVSRIHRSRYRIRMAGLELLQEQTRTRTLLRESPDAIVICDADGSIQLFSRGAETLFGYDELDLLNRPLESILFCPESYGGDVPRYLSRLRKAQADPTRQLLEAYHRNGDKLLLEFSLSLVSIDELLEEELSTPTGDYQAAMCIFHDVTLQRQAFEEMSAHHINLERLVQEMREELHAAESESRLADPQAAAALELMMQEVLEPLSNIVDLARSASSLEGASNCPQMLQAVQGIRHTAEGMVKRLKLL